MSAKIYHLDGCALADMDGILISELAAVYIAKGWPPEKALEQALGDVLLDLNRRVYAARQGV